MKYRPFFRMLAISAAILSVGGMLLWGVSRLVLQTGGQIRVYPSQRTNVFLTPETDEEIVLYPWTAMKPYREVEMFDPQEEADIAEKLANVAGNCVSFFIKNSCVETVVPGELMKDIDGKLLGMRGATVNCTLWEFTWEDANCEKELPSYEEAFSVSFAVRMGDPQTLCYLEIVPLSESSSGDEKAGYEELCLEAKNAGKAASDNNRFVAFFNNYINLCSEFGLYESEAAYSVYDAVCSGEYTTFLYDGRAYFCYSFRRINLTVFCDPGTGRVLGFSAESAG